MPYLPLFSGATNVVDIGCGRGEFLDLFREHGIAARGIDVNDEMVEACRARGLAADRADALTFLESQPDDSVGGLTAIQVVEHLEPAYLMRLIETARHKLAPGAHMVLETINAACWAAFFDSYIRDFTHAQPIHPDTLKYLVQASGFGSTELRFLMPIADHDKLPKVHVSGESGQIDQNLIDLAETINAHADRLNNQLFTFRDFAVVARK
jgi:O-antigen chain-terminating methyltransferase